MRYYLIAGEASGDLHASHLMQALKERDHEAEFRIVGGDLMQAAGGTLVRHYSTLAYMGFVSVALHLRTILKGMKQCRTDILKWKPDALILVDYPGFNLGMAKYIRQHAPHVKILYYISPKIWAWKEGRIRTIRKYVDRVYSILPFEPEYFRKRHNYEVQYVGNPTLDEVRSFQSSNKANLHKFLADCQKLDPNISVSDRPIIALLPGSRRQEIRDNLTIMLDALQPISDKYQFLIAGAPGITPDFYKSLTQGRENINVLFGQTYRLLQHSAAALVTSGTATLETALFRVPQIVCYYLPFGRFYSLLRRIVLTIPYISLVNLIANREVVPELVADGMTVENLRSHLQEILPGGNGREEMLKGYDLVEQQLGQSGAAWHTADLILSEFI